MENRPPWRPYFDGLACEGCSDVLGWLDETTTTAAGETDQ